MIVRIWRGATRAEDADAYAEYLRRTGVKEYREIAVERLSSPDR
jgi:hypothetical protein